MGRGKASISTCVLCRENEKSDAGLLNNWPGTLRICTVMSLERLDLWSGQVARLERYRVREMAIKDQMQVSPGLRRQKGATPSTTIPSLVEKKWENLVYQHQDSTRSIAENAGDATARRLSCSISNPTARSIGFIVALDRRDI